MALKVSFSHFFNISDDDFLEQLIKTREKEDLMNCFHLLLVVIDLVISDLMDQNFHQFIRQTFCEFYSGYLQLIVED